MKRDFHSFTLVLLILSSVAAGRGRAEGVPAAAPGGALYVEVSDEDLGFQAPTTVLFDGSNLNAFESGHAFEIREGLMVGTGDLVTRERFANFHLKVRVRYPDGIKDTFRLNLEDVPVFRSLAEAEQQRGEWLELEFLCRHLPGEQAVIRHLNQGFTHHGGNGQQFHDDNLHRLDQFPMNERRYVPGESQYFPGQREGLFLGFDHPVEIARMEVTPLVPQSPREILTLSGSDQAEFVEKGRTVYATYCVNCHGNGIDAPPNPLARSFASQDLQNGSSQLDIYRTLTTGFNTMPPMTVLTVEERHQVAAYIREEILKVHRPATYQEVDPQTIDALPHPLYTLREAYERVNQPEHQVAKERGYYRDHGPVIINGYGSIARNAAHIRLPDEVAVSYDLHTLTLLDVRTDGYLDMLSSQEFQQRPSSGVEPAGDPNEVLGGSSWIEAGELLRTDPQSSRVPEHSSLRYLGHHVNGDAVILSYQFQQRSILESPSAVRDGEHLSLTQHFSVGAGESIELGLVPTDLGAIPHEDAALVLERARQQVRFEVRSADPSGSNPSGLNPSGFRWTVVDGHLALQVPASGAPLDFALKRSVGPSPEGPAPEGHSPEGTEMVDLRSQIAGGPRLWPITSTVQGRLSPTLDEAYVVDTIPVPFENEYKAWMRTTALAFFPDGRAAVTTYGGDVWMVSGIDEDLEAVTWSRFASGMFEAFGCEIVDGLVHVTTRNGIVRLHDRNQDGEADFYEQFFADPDVSAKWHAYSFDLVRDSEGFFYYARSGQFTDSRLEGGVYRIAPDGRSHELFCSGFRTPNGMGILPDNRLTYGDNQGSYVPAGKLSIIQPGRWHGGTNLLASEGEKRDRVEPVLWFPQEVDNSSGGQYFVDDPRFGPYDQHLIHTSCGRAEAMVVFLDELPDGTIQAASQTLPFHFESGVMRPRVNPVDGQLYLTGTRGWQIRADYDGCLQRVRYTGVESPLLLDVKARRGGIELTFNQPMERSEMPGSHFEIEQWNYRWAATYGSKKYRVRAPDAEGSDKLEVKRVEWGDDGTSVWIRVPDLRPSDNLSLRYRLQARSGERVENMVNMTIHQLPSAQVSGHVIR